MGKQRVSSSFRSDLSRELDAWRAEGLVTPEQADEISRRYGLDDLRAESVGLLLLAIYTIGAILIGAGVISFVAAHWGSMGPWTKVPLLVGAMLAAHLTGFYFWRVRGSRPALGHGLIILGTLIFGANIALLAQIFHIQSDYYTGFGACAIGAAAMAYALRSTPNAVIALVASFVWFCGWVGDYQHGFCYYPFVAAAAMLPFAYMKRSVLTFTLTLLVAGVSIAIHAGVDGEAFRPYGLAMLGLGQLLFSWGLLSERTARFRGFAAPAGVLGVSALIAGAYPLSFHEVAHVRSDWHLDGWMWTVPVAAVCIASLFTWAIALGTALRKASARPLAAAVAAAGGLILVGMLAGEYVFATISANLALVVLAAGLAGGGVAAGSRGVFWSGLVLAALVIVSRFFEYDTGLMLKAGVFATCGVGVIFGGMMFEKYVGNREVVGE